MYNLSKQFDLFTKRTDPYYDGRENYRVQQEYLKMLRTEPSVHTPSMTVRSYEPDDGSMDI